MYDKLWTHYIEIRNERLRKRENKKKRKKIEIAKIFSSTCQKNNKRIELKKKSKRPPRFCVIYYARLLSNYFQTLYNDTFSSACVHAFCCLLWLIVYSFFFVYMYGEKNGKKIFKKEMTREKKN